MGRHSKIDRIKGITILFIVFGHLRWLSHFEFITYNLFYYALIKFLYSFHVTIFFIVGGYLIYQKIKTVSFVQFFHKKLLRLMIPFLAALIFYSAVNCLFFLTARFLKQQPICALPTIKGFSLALLMGNEHFIVNAGLHGFLWFLTAYFMKIQNLNTPLCKRG